MAITVCKFSKFFGGACLRTPLESFCYLSCLKLTLQEKTALEKRDKIWCPLPEKILNAPLT